MWEPTPPTERASFGPEEKKPPAGARGFVILWSLLIQRGTAFREQGYFEASRESLKEALRSDHVPRSSATSRGSPEDRPI